MSRRRLRLVLLVLSVPLASTPLALILFGSSGSINSNEGDEVPPLVAPLDSKPSVDLVALVGRPRSELAALAQDVGNKVHGQDQAHLEGRLPFSLVPELQLSLALPVLREARYVPRRGFSLPPYVGEDAHDSELALHLARFGDVDAALLLVDEKDSEARAKIEACRGERNYPVEWTRLAGLLLYEAELRLATGDLTGGGELAVLHRQLRAALDAKAAQGPLGAALLSRGHKAFRMAADSLRGRNDPDSAARVESFLAEWGDIPAPVVAVRPGTSRAEINRRLAVQGQGHALEAPVARALDLFGLPLPAEGVDAVLVFFEEDRLTEVLVTYRARIGERFRSPFALALHLEDHDLTGQAQPSADWLPRRRYAVGDLTCDYVMAYRGNHVGAFVRIQGQQPVAAAHLARAFGGVNLDRSFEQNRLRFAPEMLADTVYSSRAGALATIKNPLAPWQPIQVLLHREVPPPQEATSGKVDKPSAAARKPAADDRTLWLKLEYPVGDGMTPLTQRALPLWSANGPARIEAAEDANGDSLALIWEDRQTRYTLRLPNGTQPTADFCAEDCTAGTDPVELRNAVAALDRSERQERFAAGTLLTRIPRTLELEGIELGMAHEGVTPVLDALEEVLQVKLARGVAVVFPGDPPAKAAYLKRQVFIRWDESGRVAELRAIYQDAPGSPGIGAWGPELLAGWKKRCGAPHISPAPAAAVWPEFATPGKPALYRWQDDLTVLTVELAPVGAEVVLRACSAEHAAGVPLPALKFLSRGPEGCSLGDEHDELLARWKNARPTPQPDGAVDLTPPGKGPYDIVRVWFRADRVVRIVALHRDPEAAKPEEAAQDLQAAWHDQMDRLGWTRRQDFNPQGVLQSLGWQDDRTRFRYFWEKPAKNPARVYTEWKDLDNR